MTFIYTYFYSYNHLTLKRFYYIFLLFALFVISYNALASTNTENNKGVAKLESTEGAQTGEESALPKPNATGRIVSDTEALLKKSEDSTNVNSLSKFNFVFYFIYKLKYNTEPTGNEYLDFQF